MKAVTLFDDVPVAIKVQTPDATDEEVAILRHMTDAVCHTVAVLNTFDVNETESAFVMPLVRRSWYDGSSTRAIRRRARQLIEVLYSSSARARAQPGRVRVRSQDARSHHVTRTHRAYWSGTAAASCIGTSSLATCVSQTTATWSSSTPTSRRASRSAGSGSAMGSSQATTLSARRASGIRWWRRGIGTGGPTRRPGASLLH